jgi:hypothetical protein
MTICAIAPSARAQSRSCDKAVNGDSTLAMAVQAHISSSASCDNVRADVQPSAGGLTVRLRGDDGRTAVRVVSSELIAAMWIESWTRRDLGTPLLPAPPPAAPPGSDRRVPRAPDAPRTSLSVGLDTRAVTGSDDVDTRAYGANVCTRIGPLCAGLDLHFDQRGDLTANDGWTRAHRTRVDALATVRLPVALGRATVAPNLGLGLGYTGTTRQEPGDDPLIMDPNCDPAPADPMDPNQPPEPCPQPLPVYIGDGFAAHTVAVRIHGGLGLSVPITSQVSLELSAGITLSPLAHREAFSPDSEPNTDPAPPDGMTDPLLALPGEAFRSTYWGIGLRVGRP